MELTKIAAAALLALGLAMGNSANAQSSKPDSQTSQSSSTKSKSASSDASTSKGSDTRSAAAGQSAPSEDRQYRTEDRDERRDWGWLGLLGLLGLGGLFRRREHHHDVRPTTGTERVRVYEK